MSFAIQNTATKEFWTGNSWFPSLTGKTINYDNLRNQEVHTPFSCKYSLLLFAKMAYKEAKENAAIKGENCLIVEIKE